MSFRDFLLSDSGHGTVAVCLAATIIACPAALSFLVASVLLAFAFLRFRDAFSHVDKELAGAAQGEAGVPETSAQQPAPAREAVIPPFLAMPATKPASNGVHLPIRL